MEDPAGVFVCAQLSQSCPGNAEMSRVMFQPGDKEQGLWSQTTL